MPTSVPTTDPTIKPRLTALESADVSLDTRLDTAESSISTLTSDVAALGGGGHTTQAAIQNALTNDITTGKPVILASANIPLTTPLEMVDGVGGALLGQGGTENGGAIQRVGTKLYNSAGGGILDYDRTDSRIEGIGFYGANPSSLSGTKGTYGIKVSKTALSIGSGKIRGANNSYVYLQRGIQLGENLTDANCDENVFYNEFFNQCDECITLMNSFALTNTFYFPRFSSNTYCIRAYAGGKFTAYHTFIGNPTTFLRVDSDNLVGGWGPNASNFSFFRIDIDAQAKGSLLLDMEQIEVEGYYLNVLFDNVIFPLTYSGVAGGWGGPGMKLSGHCMITLRNCVNVPRGFIRSVGAGSRKRVIIQNCIIGDHSTSSAAITDIFDTAGSTAGSRIRYVAQNNWYVYSDTPFADTPSGGASITF